VALPSQREQLQHGEGRAASFRRREVGHQRIARRAADAFAHAID
jgi:hypothetical protein